MAEACKRLIKNCIICWNYLYLSQKLEEIKDTASREAFLDAVAHGSAVAWQHLNLLGEYDFSDEKLARQNRNSTPKIGGLNGVPRHGFSWERGMFSGALFRGNWRVNYGVI